MLEQLLKWLQDKKRGYQIGSPEYDQMPFLGTPPTVYGKPDYYQAQPTLPNWEKEWDKLRQNYQQTDSDMLEKIQRMQNLYNANLAPIQSHDFRHWNNYKEWLGRALNDPDKTLREMEKLEKQGIRPFTINSI